LSKAERELKRADARPRIVRNKRVRIQYAPTSRRLFQGEVRETFLEWFAATANVSLSARKADVHYRTVLRHRMEDAEFAARMEAALEAGMVRVRAWALELGEEAGFERVDVPVSMKPVNLTPDMALQLIREDERRKAAALRGTAFGPRPGRAPTVATSAEVQADLAKAMRADGERLRARERAAGAAAADDPPSRDASADGGGEGADAEQRPTTLRPGSGQAALGTNGSESDPPSHEAPADEGGGGPDAEQRPSTTLGTNESEGDIRA
jgi:hypothetical protein